MLEILAAIAIFSILITAVIGAFRSIHLSAEALVHDDLYYRSVETALSLMTQDLRALYATRPPVYNPPGFNKPADPYRVLGEQTSVGGNFFSKLRFTSISHIAINGTDTAGIAEIVYYVDQPDSEPYILRRADHLRPYPSFEESGNDPVLCEKIKSLSFTYHDAAGEIHDEWDSDSSDYGYATPSAIEISLEVGDEAYSVALRTIVFFPVFREEITGAR